MTSFRFWGIDGCKKGWMCIGIDDRDKHTFAVCENIQNVAERLRRHGAEIALIDIPIGFSDNAGERDCDKAARKYIGARSSSVFRAPCRQAVDAYQESEKPGDGKERAGKLASVEITGMCLSAQTWGIVPKIAEVDAFLRGIRKTCLREVHPEVCFRALAGKELQHGKTKPPGLAERKRILESHFSKVAGVCEAVRKCRLKKDVADDDILDALAAAVTAKIGASGKTELKTFPQNPPKDRRGFPMEMAYADPHGKMCGD